MNAICIGALSTHVPKHFDRQDMHVYDYVVVGAGSAGCVLAARLTEDPSVSLALIEAGGEDTAPEIRIPTAFPALFKSAWDWDFDSECEPGLGGRRVYLPRGRMLGGSSSMNAMVYIRGNANDYDEWASAGAPGWGYRDVLPYFIRSEDNERGGDEYHGVGGPQHVCDGRAMSRAVAVFLESADEAGYPANPDFNGASQLGVGRYQLTQHNGMRWSTADGYLRPALARPNLTVITGALAHRVVFEGDRAIGVEISSGAEMSVVRAECEVVLSAGSYGSPHLLLLSGVGPTADLRPFGKPYCRRPTGRARPPRPHAVCDQLPDRRRVVDDRRQPGERRGAAGTRPRTADLQHRRSRRIPADPSRHDRPRHPTAQHPGHLLRRGFRRATGTRHRDRGEHREPGE